MTTGLLGVDDHGSPVGGATATDVGTDPGYSDTWFDLSSQSMQKH